MSYIHGYRAFQRAPALIAPPPIRFSTDGNDHKMRVARLITAGQAGRAEVARSLGEVFISRAMQYSRHDTNRYRRGWAIAGNEAGAGLHTVPSLQPSRNRETYIALLEAVVDRYNRRIRKLDGLIELLETKLRLWFDSRRQTLQRRGNGRKGMKRSQYPAEREMRRKVKRMQLSREKLVAKRDRAQAEVETYAGFEYAIFIGGRRGRISDRTGRWIGQRDASARTNISGGRGQMLEAGGQTIYRFENLEPHARLVEKRDRVVYKAAGDVMRLGGRRIGRRFWAELAKDAA